MLLKRKQKKHLIHSKIQIDLPIAEGINTFKYIKSAAKHLTDLVKPGDNSGQLSSPFMKSLLTIREILSSGKGYSKLYLFRRNELEGLWYV